MTTIITYNDKITYKSMDDGYGINDPSRVAMFLYVKPKSYVLSAGCGTGREISYLNNVLKCKVIGIDIDQKALLTSKNRNPHSVHILGDMVYRKFNKKFDYIVCLWNTINYIEEKFKKQFIQTCYDNLKSNGTLIIITTSICSHWRHILSNIKHWQHFHPYPLEINGWFINTGFEVIKKRMGKNILIIANKEKK